MSMCRGISAESSQYARQLTLPEIGQQGQEALAKAHVVVIGAGGLGNVVLTYLASAGVGTITIIDHDTISVTNLNRQFLYSHKDLHQKKAEVLQRKLSEQYNCVTFFSHTNTVDRTSLEECIGVPDCVVLCVDNIETRLLVNEYAIKRALPLVDGGVDGFYGYILCYEPRNINSPCLACATLFNANTAHQCCVSNRLAESRHKEPSTALSALGVTCGVIGSLQASLCLNLLLEMKNPYQECVLHYDGKCGEFDKIPLRQNPLCRYHGLDIA